MAAPKNPNHHRLYGVLALADHSVHEMPGPFPGLFIPLPHPVPGNPIGIVTAICRIHILSAPIPGVYATVLFLVRATDFSLIGGCATDVVDSVADSRGASSTLADREFNWAPNFYEIAGDDALFAVFRTFWSGDRGAAPAKFEEPFHATLDVLYNYWKLDDHGDPI